MITEMPNDPHQVLDTFQYPMQKITDVSVLKGFLNPAYPYSGFPERGFTTGYSNRFMVNADNTMLIAFGVQGWISSIYALVNGGWTFYRVLKFPDWYHETIGIGEQNDPRWDYNDPEILWYTTGSRLCAMDVKLGANSIVNDYTMSAPIIPQNHMDQSYKYRTVTTSNYTYVVNLSSGLQTMAVNRGVCDISPDDNWLMVQNPYTVFINLNDSRKIALPSSVTGMHDGWAYTAEGECVYIYQDSKIDYICAFDPDANKLYKIAAIGELAPGADLHMHFARMPDAVNCRGWIAMSTYIGGDPLDNQLMLMEIATGKIIRLGHNLTQYVNGGYFTEGFITMTRDGNGIIWSNNQNGTTNLELYYGDISSIWTKPADPKITLVLQKLGELTSAIKALIG
jgi:hypothetical protein